MGQTERRAKLGRRDITCAYRNVDRPQRNLRVKLDIADLG